RGDLWKLIDLHFMPEACPPQRIDASMDSDAAKPRDTMRSAFDGFQTFVKLQKNFLRHFLSYGGVVKEVKGDAVDHSLMLVNRGFKVGFRHLPSKLITDARV